NDHAVPPERRHKSDRIPAIAQTARIAQVSLQIGRSHAIGMGWLRTQPQGEVLPKDKQSEGTFESSTIQFFVTSQLWICRHQAVWQRKSRGKFLTISGHNSPPRGHPHRMVF